MVFWGGFDITPAAEPPSCLHPPGAGPLRRAGPLWAGGEDDDGRYLTLCHYNVQGFLMAGLGCFGLVFCFFFFPPPEFPPPHLGCRRCFFFKCMVQCPALAAFCPQLPPHTEFCLYNPNFPSYFPPTHTPPPPPRAPTFSFIPTCWSIL